MTTFAERLKELRKEKHLTQQELADQIGVRRETIGHLENNRYNPSLEMALKIVKIFDMKIEDIFQLRKED